MPIIGTVSSGYYVLPVYELSQTFNASGTYTVPAGASAMALLIVGSGGGGGANPNFREFGAGGGSGGALLAVKDYPVTPGQTYSITIGSGGNNQGSGGASSVGNLVTINGGNPGTLNPNTSRGIGGVPGNITSNINSYHVSNYGGATGGDGGTSFPYGGSVPTAGTSATAVSMNLTGLGSVSIGSNAGSGGGGAGYNHTNNSSARIGASGGTGGGSGGNGDLLDPVNESFNANANDGGSTTQKGAGGGGSGGVYYTRNAKVGGSAGPAQILVYVK